MTRFSESRLHDRLVGQLYVDAMLLADEARTYFDEAGRGDRHALDPSVRVAFSCESLKVTTRLMHVIAWLLTQRAVQTGELDTHDARSPDRRLGTAPDSRPDVLAALPVAGRALALTSIDIYRRAARLDRVEPPNAIGPAQSLQSRLANAF